jgi:hypothetical protein
MNVKVGTWHYKLFEKWRSLKYKGWKPYRYYDGLTLCCYVKAVFLFAVPRIIFQSKESRLLLLNFLLSLIVYFEITNLSFLVIMIEISTTILILCGLLIFGSAIAGAIWFFSESDTSKTLIEPYLKTKKDKICPHIDFIE